MNHPDFFADRMHAIPESFIREILKVAASNDVISFAGGLPNPAFFPVEELAVAAERVISRDGRAALQYGPTEGFMPLREYLAERQSSRAGFRVSTDQILILNGAQQGLDLAAKIFCNKNTPLLLEEPSYLGAIQAFSAYEPTLHSVPLDDEGADPVEFSRLASTIDPAFFYCIPNFQNPTGGTYSKERRIQLVEAQKHSDMFWVEDNPYGDVKFSNSDEPDIYTLHPDRTIHLGSFSKIVSPGLRLGWATAPAYIIRKMTIAKQASDLHSNLLAQRILYQFLCDHSLEAHVKKVSTFYKNQCAIMSETIRATFPEGISFTQPQGGMFLWITLPATMDAEDILRESMAKGVVFVPGHHFFLDRSHGRNTMRLNYSASTEETMRKGLAIIAEIIRSRMS